MPLRNVPITYTLDQQRQEINALAVDVNSIDINFEERVDDRVSLLISGGNGISTSYNDVSNTLDVSLNFAEFSSSSILEGTNLYYTSTRANAAIDGRVTRTFVNNLGITQGHFIVFKCFWKRYWRQSKYCSVESCCKLGQSCGCGLFNYIYRNFDFR